MPPTMAEREAELAALQSAFDEYIASSRELEEELDAELAKMRKSWSTFTFGCHIPVFLVLRWGVDFEFPIQERVFVFWSLYSIFYLNDCRNDHIARSTRDSQS